MVYITVPNTLAAVRYDPDKGKWITCDWPSMRIDPVVTPNLGVEVQGVLDLEEPSLNIVGSMLTTLDEAWTTLCCAAYAKRPFDEDLPGHVENAQGVPQLPAGLTLDAPSKLVRKLFGHTLAVAEEAPMCGDEEILTSVANCLAAYAPLGAKYQQYTCLKALGVGMEDGLSEPPDFEEPPDPETAPVNPAFQLLEEYGNNPPSLPPDDPEPAPSLPPEDPAPEPALPPEIVEEPPESMLPPGFSMPEPPSNEVPVMHIGTFTYDPISNTWAPGTENVPASRIMIEPNGKQKLRMRRIAEFVASLEFLAALYGPTRTQFRIPSHYEQTSRLSLCMERNKDLYEFTKRGWEEVSFMGMQASNVMPSFTLGCKLSFDNDIVFMRGEDWEFLVAHTLNTFNTLGEEINTPVDISESVPDEIPDANVIFYLRSVNAYMQYDFHTGAWGLFDGKFSGVVDARMDLSPKDIAFEIGKWGACSTRTLVQMLSGLEDAYRTYCSVIYQHRDELCTHTVYGNYDTLMVCMPDSSYPTEPGVRFRSGQPDISIALHGEGTGSYIHSNSGWIKTAGEQLPAVAPNRAFGMDISYVDSPASSDAHYTANFLMETMDAFRPCDTEETKFVYAITHFV